MGIRGSQDMKVSAAPSTTKSIKLKGQARQALELSIVASVHHYGPSGWEFVRATNARLSVAEFPSFLEACRDLHVSPRVSSVAHGTSRGRKVKKSLMETPRFVRSRSTRFSMSKPWANQAEVPAHETSSEIHRLPIFQSAWGINPRLATCCLNG